jgi:hypothetical protein
MPRVVRSYRLTTLFLVLGFAGLRSGLGSGGAARILRSASSNSIGASVKGLPCFPAGLGLPCFILRIVALSETVFHLSIIESLQWQIKTNPQAIQMGDD